MQFFGRMTDVLLWNGHNLQYDIYGHHVDIYWWNESIHEILALMWFEQFTEKS
jgi:hypothetical protein